MGINLIDSKNLRIQSPFVRMVIMNISMASQLELGQEPYACVAIFPIALINIFSASSKSF